MDYSGKKMDFLDSLPKYDILKAFLSKYDYRNGQFETFLTSEVRKL